MWLAVITMRMLQNGYGCQMPDLCLCDESVSTQLSLQGLHSLACSVFALGGKHRV